MTTRPKLLACCCLILLELGLGSVVQSHTTAHRVDQTNKCGAGTNVLLEQGCVGADEEGADPLRYLDLETARNLLNQIIEYELAGVVRYTHYALMVRGPSRVGIVEFFKAQAQVWAALCAPLSLCTPRQCGPRSERAPVPGAQESLVHARQAGEILTNLQGHPSVNVAAIQETNQHTVGALLKESYEHERDAIGLYKKLLSVVADGYTYLEDYARGQIGQEEMHLMEIAKMLRDYEI